MRLPVWRQLAAHCLLPELAEFGVLLLILLYQLFPFALLLRAPFDRFSEMRDRFIGHVELFVFGPAEMPLGFFYALFAGSVAVSFARAGGGHPITNRRLNGNHRRGRCD